MHIEYFLLAFTIILGSLLSSKDSKKNRCIYIILCSSVLLFVGAMRSPDWFTIKYGIDTAVYKNLFESTFDISWQEFWYRVIYRYVRHESEDDIGFMGLQWFISLFTHDYGIFSLIADLLFFVPFGLLLYRYTTSMKQLIFVFVFYIALIQIHILSGARQIFAIGLDIFAVMSIMDGKKVRSIVLLILGATIHFSSLLMLLPILAIWFNLSPQLLKRIHVFTFIMFPIVLMYPNEIIQFMGETSGIEKYAEFSKHGISGGADTFIILLELLSFVMLIAIKKRLLQENKALRQLYIMVPLFTIFGPLIHSNGSMVRIALYFYIYITLLFPYSIDSMFLKNNKVIYVFAIGILALLTSGGLEYYFYWQR